MVTHHFIAYIATVADLLTRDAVIFSTSPALQ